MEIAFGERPEDDPLARALLGHPGARERLEELRALARDLRRAGTTEREVLEEVERTAGAPGEDDVAETLRRLARDEPHESPPPRELPTGERPPTPSLRRVGLAWTAAAALVVALLGWVALREDTGPGPIDTGPLGDGALEAVRPVGDVEGFAPFEWSSELEGYAGFRVSVYDAVDDAFLPLLESGLTTETRWDPTPDELRTLPDTIRWTVERVGTGGEVDASVEVSARRSSG